eukprot:158437_1
MYHISTHQKHTKALSSFVLSFEHIFEIVSLFGSDNVFPSSPNGYHDTSQLVFASHNFFMRIDHGTEPFTQHIDGNLSRFVLPFTHIASCLFIQNMNSVTNNKNQSIAQSTRFWINQCIPVTCDHIWLVLFLFNKHVRY